MIRDVEAYNRLRVDDERCALIARDEAGSLAIGEALWTSRLLHEMRLPPGPRALNLATGLGVTPARLAAALAHRSRSG